MEVHKELGMGFKEAIL